MDYQRGERYELTVTHLPGTDDLESTIFGTYFALVAVATGEPSDPSNWHNVYVFDLDEPIQRGLDSIGFRPERIVEARHLPRE